MTLPSLPITPVVVGGLKKSWFVAFVIILSSILQTFVHGQISTHPVVLSRLRSSTALTCHSNGIPLRLCIWEQKDSDKLIATFDATTTSDQPFVGESYSYYGSGLDKGQCGIRIASVQETDLQRWKCTLVGSDNATTVLRGSVLLQGSEEVEPEENVKGTVEVTQQKPIRLDSRHFNTGVARPIVTAEAFVPQTSVPASSNSQGIHIQEVEVQSSGIVIVPRRKDRKLVIF